MNDLTRSFLKGSLKNLMKMLEAGAGALFLFNPDAGSLVLESFLGGSADREGRFFRLVRRPCISIPLFASGEFFGFIKIGTRPDGVRFSAQDLRFANALCGHICRIVEDQMRFTCQRSGLDHAMQEKSSLEKFAAVGSLAAGIAGRVNSPLDGALRYAGLVRAHLDNDERHKEYLALIKQGLERIAGITASLAGLYGPSCGCPDREESVDIHQLIDEAVDVFSSSCKDTVRIIVQHDGPLRVRSDQAVRHVFTNMIKNAIEAMPDGGTLTISSEVKQAGLRIVFQDTGSGITAEHQRKIFEPFFTTKPEGAGSGFGLALCKDIVERYGGRIGVKSAPEQGSAFTILFPRSMLA